MPKKIFLFALGLVIVVLTLFFNLKGHFFPTAVGASNLALGDLVKLANDPAVYLVGQDSKRYVFPNESVYYSWYSAADFNNVKTISASEMANLPIGGNVTIRPGTKLVKITTDPKVYAVTKSGLRWVTTEAIALELYGSNWARRVVDVSDAFWLNYSFGSAIETAVHPEGTLIKKPDSNAIYLMKENGKVDVFNNYSGFSGNGFKEDNVIETTKSYESSGSGVGSFVNSLRYPDKALSSTPDQSQCSANETKKYTCTDGTQVSWCGCENGHWVCITSPEIQCDSCKDMDGDGYSKGNCSPFSKGVDCNDNTSAINPNASEVCNDAVDNNCNGQIDENCQQYCSDNTAYGQCSVTKPKYCDNGTLINKCSQCPCSSGQQCQSNGSCLICTDNDSDGYYSQGGGCGTADCNDNNASVHPGATEVCDNDIDDDCDFSTDEGCQKFNENPIIAIVLPRDWDFYIVGDTYTGSGCPGTECCGIGYSEPYYMKFKKNANFKTVPIGGNTSGYQQVMTAHTGWTDVEVDNIKVQMAIMKSKFYENTNGDINLQINYIDLYGTGTMGIMGCGVMAGPTEMKSTLEPLLTTDVDAVGFIQDSIENVTGKYIPFFAAGLAWGVDAGVKGAGYWLVRETTYDFSYHELLHVYDLVLNQLQSLGTGYQNGYQSNYPACGQGTSDKYYWFPSADDCTFDPDYSDCGLSSCTSANNFADHILNTHWNPAWQFLGNHCRDAVKNYGETGVDTGGVCS